MSDTVSHGTLSAVVSPEEYRQPPERSRLFGSPGSLQWYIRTRRAELTKAGALLVVGGRVHIHAQRFDEFVLRAGAAEAAERCA